MFFRSNLLGALTAKPHAFRARPWELQPVATADLWGPWGQPVRLDRRGPAVVRVLPADPADPWIADRSRFAYDGLRRQRLVRPRRGDGRPVPWAAAPGLPPPRPAGSWAPGPLVYWATAGRVPRLWHRHRGPAARRPPGPSRLAPLAPASWDLLLLVALPLREEQPVLTARLRPAAAAGRLRLAAAGCAVAGALPLGNGVGPLARLLEGRHPLARPLAAAAVPAVLLGPALDRRRDGPAWTAWLDRLGRRLPALAGGPLHPDRGPLQWALEGLPPGPLVGAGPVQLLGTGRPVRGRPAAYGGSHGGEGAAGAALLLPAAGPLERPAAALAADGRFRSSPGPDRSPLPPPAALVVPPTGPEPSPPAFPLAAGSVRSVPPGRFRLGSGPLRPLRVRPDPVAAASPTLGLVRRHRPHRPYLRP